MQEKPDFAQEMDAISREISEMETRFAAIPDCDANAALKQSMAQLLAEMKRADANMRQMLNKDET